MRWRSLIRVNPLYLSGDSQLLCDQGLQESVQRTHFLHGLLELLKTGESCTEHVQGTLYL